MIVINQIQLPEVFHRDSLLLSCHSDEFPQIHLISEDGTYRTEVMGNPLSHKSAKFLVHVPRATYSVFESLSADEATFHSYIDIPGMRCCIRNHSGLPPE